MFDVPVEKKLRFGYAAHVPVVVMMGAPVVGLYPVRVLPPGPMYDHVL